MNTDHQDLLDAFLDVLAASELVDAFLKLVILVGVLGIVVGLLGLVMSTPHHTRKGGPRR